jgi:hypothetical protein
VIDIQTIISASLVSCELSAIFASGGAWWWMNVQPHHILLFLVKDFADFNQRLIQIKTKIHNRLRVQFQAVTANHAHFKK